MCFANFMVITTKQKSITDTPKTKSKEWKHYKKDQPQKKTIRGERKELKWN